MIADYDAITRLIAELCLKIDHQDWEALTALFCPQVITDYTSLFGGEIQHQNSVDLIEGWKKFLPNTFHSTVHLVGLPAIHFSPNNHNTATVHAPVTAWHNYEDGIANDSKQWIVGGHYLIEAENSRDQWLIRSLTLEARWQKGRRPQ